MTLLQKLRDLQKFRQNEMLQENQRQRFYNIKETLSKPVEYNKT